MALIFTTNISEEDLLFTANNNIIRFSSDSDKTPLNASIIGIGIQALLYPSPDGQFFFNFETYASTHVNTFRFNDPVVPALVAADPDSFTYNAEEGTFKSGPVEIKITFIDETFEAITKQVNFISGVIQLEDFKNQRIPIDKNYVVLSPVKSRSNNNVFLKFWEGYPFEFSMFTKKPLEVFKIKNQTNSIEQEFTAKSKVTAVVLSDGRSDISIEDFLPLITGTNVLNIFHEDLNQRINIFLNKADADCGIYIKWRNHLGRFNYWLLDKNSKRDRGFRSGEEVQNDFENLENTTSPTFQTGKQSEDLLRCIVKNLNEEEKNVFVGLYDSPKVFLFTGERFARARMNDWIEVKVNTTSASIEDSNKNLQSYNVEIALPSRYNQTL